MLLQGPLFSWGNLGTESEMTYPRWHSHYVLNPESKHHLPHFRASPCFLRKQTLKLVIPPIQIHFIESVGFGKQKKEEKKSTPHLFWGEVGWARRIELLVPWLILTCVSLASLEICEQIQSWGLMKNNGGGGRSGNGLFPGLRNC